MKTSTKWIIGITAGVIIVLCIGAVGVYAVSRAAASVWVAGTKSGLLWDDDEAFIPRLEFEDTRYEVEEQERLIKELEHLEQELEQEFGFDFDLGLHQEGDVYEDYDLDRMPFFELDMMPCDEGDEDCFQGRGRMQIFPWRMMPFYGLEDLDCEGNEEECVNKMLELWLGEEFHLEEGMIPEEILERGWLFGGRTMPHERFDDQWFFGEGLELKEERSKGWLFDEDREPYSNLKKEYYDQENAPYLDLFGRKIVLDPGSRSYVNFSPLRAILLPLCCLGFLFVLGIIGLIAFLATRNRRKPPALPSEPVPAPSAPPPAAPVTSMINSCDYCGQPLQEGWSHCPFCGAGLVDANEEAPEAQVEPDEAVDPADEPEQEAEQEE